MNTYWAVALENILITLCFAWVAIHFNHWWIILFAILGWTTVNIKK